MTPEQQRAELVRLWSITAPLRLLSYAPIGDETWTEAFSRFCRERSAELPCGQIHVVEHRVG